MEKKYGADGQETERVYTVGLKGMEFVGFHGCREDEKNNGNIFRVDFEGEYSGKAGKTDALEDAVNYGQVYGVIAEVMYGERRNLLESLSESILEAVRGKFPRLSRIKVSVAKKNPPVAGRCEWSDVKVSWSK